MSSPDKFYLSGGQRELLNHPPVLKPVRSDRVHTHAVFVHTLVAFGPSQGAWLREHPQLHLGTSLYADLRPAFLPPHSIVNELPDSANLPTTHAPADMLPARYRAKGHLLPR